MLHSFAHGIACFASARGGPVAPLTIEPVTAVDGGRSAPRRIDGVLLQIRESRVDALDGLIRFVGLDQFYPGCRRPSVVWVATITASMKLPNGNRAIVDLRKLQAYCLNPQHPRGGNKARVFASIGIRESDAEELRTTLLAVAADSECQPGAVSPHGQR